MFRKLLPLLLALIGLGGGVGAGILLRPAPETTELTDPCGDAEPSAKPASVAVPEEGGDAVPTHDYVKLNNQFVVPVVSGGEVSAMVILSLSLEVTLGSSETVYSLEPKLRDSFLQVLFDHANAGGFAGAFTGTPAMNDLRMALLESAHAVMGDTVSDVLIVDLVRQDK